MKEKKTNAMRLIENAQVHFVLHEYSVDDGMLDAVSIARKIGREPDRVFKTLVTVAASGKNYVFIVPGNGELDLKKAAKVAGEKSIDMLPSKLLLPLTGYIHGGCSPVGMKKLFPSFLDETAVLFDTICVSGGRIGTNVELAPDTLLALIRGSFADLQKM